MDKVYNLKEGGTFTVKQGETLFDAFYRTFCWNCTRAPICHSACCEFDDRCENIDEVTEIMDELGVKYL